MIHPRPTKWEMLPEEVREDFDGEQIVTAYVMEKFLA